MAQYDVPVTITAKDEASDKIENIGKESKKTRKAIDDFANKAKKKFKELAGSAGQTQVSFMEFQSRVEMVKAAIGFVTGSIAAFTEAAKEMRGENDQLVKSVDDVGMALKGAQGALGDIGLALVQVFEEDAKEASAEFQKTIRDNRETIVQFLAFFVQAGKRMFALTKALVIGPFNLLVDGFRTTVQAIIAGTVNAIQWALSKVGVEFETLDILADSTADTLDHFLKEGDKSLDMIGSGFMDVLDSVTETGEVMDRVTANMQKDPYKARLKTAEKLTQDAEKRAEAAEKEKNAKKGIVDQEVELLKIEKLKDQLAKEKAQKEKEREEMINAFLAKRAAQIDAETAKEDARLKIMDDLLQERTEHYEKELEKATSIAEAFATAATESDNFTKAIINGTIAATKATAELVVDMLRKIIMTKAIEGAVGAASSVSALGPIAMGAAGLAALGVAQGFINQIPKFAEGGMVRGGVQGQDSVPALLMPGEYVMNVNQVEAMRQMFSNMDGVNSSGRFANGGTVGPAPSLGGVNITIKSDALPNRAEVTKYVRNSIVPALRDLRAQGVRV